MTKFNSNYLDCLPFSDQTVQIALAANAALSYTIPGNPNDRYRCEFAWAYNANVWVGYNYTAVVPVAAAITTATNASIELRPLIRYVKGGDVLSFISDSIVSNAGFSLLQLPSPKG